MPRSFRFLDVKVSDITYSEAVDDVSSFIASGQPHQIATVNPEFIMSARRHPEFKAVLNNCDLTVPDGVGLTLVGALTRRKLRQRVTGVDLIEALCRAGAKKGWRFFLLGAAEGVAKQAGEILATKYPGLQVVGSYAGSPDPAYDNETAAIITEAKPDILLVAYGAGRRNTPPPQDLWIARNQPKLGVPVAMGVGGSFNYITGTSKRAPKWLRTIGLEWFYRLITEPWRWRRMLVLPKFAFLALAEKHR